MNSDHYKKDLEALVLNGERLTLAMMVEVASSTGETIKLTEDQRKALPNVREEYQAWYSEALAAIRQLLPDRLDDFVRYYKPTRPRKELNASTYTISDYLQGITASRGTQRIVGLSSAINPLEQQVNIVKALRKRFETSLFDIKALVQADLFDNELEAAEELNKRGYARAAGAVAGVVLEEHLATVARQHSLKQSRTPTISELNDLLKKNETIDIPTWRFIQHLGDLRNLCDHKKTSDPTKENVHELVEGVRKIIKTVF